MGERAEKCAEEPGNAPRGRSICRRSIAQEAKLLTELSREDRKRRVERDPCRVGDAHHALEIRDHSRGVDEPAGAHGLKQTSAGLP